uniref:Tyr recombinase domain-containing protein n=1 Tax=Xenopus tropicalis TaxID=8364 RepID=A0A803JVB7_XENTR
MDCLSAIQDGVGTFGNSSNGTRGIFDIPGHERRVPSCSNIPASSSVSSVRIPRSAFSVYCLTLRAFISTSNIHKNNGYNGSPPPSPRSVYHSILGRPIGQGSITASSREGSGKDHADSAGFRVDNQQTKIVPCPIPEDAFSGISFRHPSGKGSSPGREGTQTYLIGTGPTDNSKAINSPLHESAGNDGILNGSCSISAVSYQTPTTEHNIGMEEIRMPFPQNKSQYLGKEILAVVDSTNTSVSRTVNRGTSMEGDNDRCQSVGLGSNIPDTDRPGPMVRVGKKTPNKYIGDQGNLPSGNSLGGSVDRPRRSNPVGQRYGCSVSKQTRRDKEPCCCKRDKQDILLGRDKSKPDLSGPHTRSGKLGGGLSKSASCGSDRVGTEQRGLRIHHGQMGSTRSGPHGVPSQPKDRQIHSKDKGSSGRGNGCHDSEMGMLTSVRIPSNSDVATYSKENKAREGYVHCHSTILAKEVVVYTSDESFSGSTNKVTTKKRSTTPGTDSTSQSRNVQFDGMEIEKLIWTRKGFSSEVAQTMIKARKKVSSKAYHRIWKLFMEWCFDRRIPYQGARVPMVLQFLQDGLQKGLSLGTLKVQVSALSILLQSRLALQEDVRTFLQGVAHIAPPVRSPVPPWDLNVVLSALINSPFEPLSIIELRWLTWKVVFLLAISSARRVSELNALSCESPYLIFHKEKAVLRTMPSFLPKVVSSFHLNEEIVIPSFCSSPKNEKEAKLHNLDVVRALHTYVDHTAHFRRSKSLFVIPSGSRKGLPASKATIARWIKETVRQAYISLQRPPPFRITAHSTRAISTSWACRNMASAEQLCRAATWSSAHTFTKFYRFDTFASAQAAFGRKVQQAVVS